MQTPSGACCSMSMREPLSPSSQCALELLAILRDPGQPRRAVSAGAQVLECVDIFRRTLLSFPQSGGGAGGGARPMGL